MEEMEGDLQCSQHGPQWSSTAANHEVQWRQMPKLQLLTLENNPNAFKCIYGTDTDTDSEHIYSVIICLVQTNCGESLEL